MEPAFPLVLVCVALVAIGTLPLWVSLVQFLMIGVHGAHNHLRMCADYTPRVAFVIPAWNEAASLSGTIDALMRVDYPDGGWRIYVVDDASTDETGTLLSLKSSQYPGYLHHLRRERGGQGKAHALNHGLASILAEEWAEAVMIMDADVLFEPLTLRRMARHLADPQVGAVTAYIKEGSPPSGVLTRFIAFEYITSQAAARRAQNVLGALACLAGGAQLHSRASLEALGGAIDTSSLAEDTFTTFQTQLQGRKALFDPNAVVWAEEPDSLHALWKQRLRWARGNLQLSWAFRHLWFRPWRDRRIGGTTFGLQWFAILFIPLFILSATSGLVGLLLLRPNWALEAVAALWGLAIAAYLFQTAFSLIIDPATGRRAWMAGILFPGVVTLTLMSLFLVGGVTGSASFLERDALLWAASLWPALAMLLAWGVYRAERAGAPAWLRNGLLVIIGYGPLMSAISLAAMAAQARGAESRWDKTAKQGKARMIDAA